MLIFQVIAIPILLIVVGLELRVLFRSELGSRYHLVRILILLTSIVAIAFPAVSSWIARHVGITRGTDLVLYVFMLMTVAAFFRLYTGQFLLQQRIAELSRKVALEGVKDQAVNCSAKSEDQGGRDAT